MKVLINVSHEMHKESLVDTGVYGAPAKFQAHDISVSGWLVSVFCRSLMR